MLTRHAVNIRQVYNVRWLKKLGIGGFVWFPTIYFAEPKERVSDEVFRHEMQHVYQIIAMGKWKFFFTWFWYSLSRGYLNNPLEIEAIANQCKPLNQAERMIKDGI